MNVQTETQTITMEYDLAHSPAKVWRALTDPSLVAQWLMQTDMEATVGKAFNFRSPPTKWWDGIVNCEVLEVEQEKRLCYTWRSGTPPDGLDTVVTWTLTPTAAGTHLMLEHSGFTQKDEFASGGAKNGWKKMLEERLTAVLDGME